jgi:hypothetical protein
MSDFNKANTRLDEATVRKISDFLFGKDIDSKYMDIRTEITGKQMFTALTYYRILQEQLKCKTAGVIADILERLSISTQRRGRSEGVQVLMQQLPKTETLMQGVSELLIRKTQGEPTGE